MRYRLVVRFLSPLLFFPLIHLYGEQGDSLLHKLIHAPRRTDFSGQWETLNTKTGSFGSAWRIVHEAPDQTRIEKEDGTRIIQNQDTVITKYAGELGSCTDSLLNRYHYPPLPFLTARHKTQAVLKTYYAIQISEVPPLHGRPTQRIIFTPTLGDKPSWHFLIDQRTGLVLELKKYTPSDSLCFHGRFKQIDFKPAFPTNAFRPPSQRPGVPKRTIHCHTHLKPIEQALGVRIPQPTWLPRGFSLHQSCLGWTDDRPTVTLIYSDGLSRLQLDAILSKNPTSDGYASDPAIRTFPGSTIIIQKGRRGEYRWESDLSRTTLERAATSLWGDAMPDRNGRILGLKPWVAILAAALLISWGYWRKRG